jgi:hypothetical protein
MQVASGPDVLANNPSLYRYFIDGGVPVQYKHLQGHTVDDLVQVIGLCAAPAQLFLGHQPVHPQAQRPAQPQAKHPAVCQRPASGGHGDQKPRRRSGLSPAADLQGSAAPALWL